MHHTRFGNVFLNTAEVIFKTDIGATDKQNWRIGRARASEFTMVVQR
jgi:hypothetical protein